MSGISESTPSRVLTIRVFRSSVETPDEFPVEATLDDAWTVSATATIKPDQLTQKDASEYGRQLGQSLFASPALQRMFNHARGRGPHVSIGLWIDAEELAGVAWERLFYVGGGEELPLATAKAISLTRRTMAAPQEHARPAGPFRLLLVLASPSDLPADGNIKPLAVAEEVRSLRTAWDPQVRRGLMRVSILGRLPPGELPALATAGYHVIPGPATLNALADHFSDHDGLHLIAHGRFRNGRASVLLEDPEGRSAVVLEEEFLAKTDQSGLRLVFLQACQTAAGEANAVSGLAPKIAQRAAAVVAMSDFVRMEDATRFAQEFYDTLLRTGEADRAVNAGRQALFMDRPGHASWSIPALYLAPNAGSLWCPDRVLRGVQDLAENFRHQPEVQYPFPIEVIRHRSDESPQMETSPPGPRMRVADAVFAGLDGTPSEREPILVIVGNYGRAKTSQLRSVYADYAGRMSRGSTALPFFAKVSDFPVSDDRAERVLATAIEGTYAKEGIELPAAEVGERLNQPFLVCVDGDDGGDSRRLTAALDCLQSVIERNARASAVIAIDLEQLATVVRLNGKVAIMLMQLLSPATVAQHLTALASSEPARGEQLKGLLCAIQSANLFDVAGVPWLLSYLIRQAGRGLSSRSGVIGRIVDENFASADLPAGVRRIVQDLLGRVAWHLQTHQQLRIDGAHLYEVLDQVRGRRELGLEELKAAAVKTRMLTAGEDDGVRFSYPGFQSYFCARHLLELPGGKDLRLDDISATLGRRSRVRLWEDTLVLLSGMIANPDDLMVRILEGSGMSHGEHVFLAARCLHEATLSKHEVSREVTTQVLDSLVWRSTSQKEARAAIRVQATECLGLLKDAATIPHLVSIAMERVRPMPGGRPAFELSGLRHAAVQALLTMADETSHCFRARASGPLAGSSEPALSALIELWQAADGEGLRQMFRTTAVDGLPAIVAFALASLGTEENMEFLSTAILDPDAAEDTRWSIADSLLQFNPVAVTRGPIAKMRQVPALHGQAVHMIGSLRVAVADSEETRFLETCLMAPEGTTQGMALRALAQLGDASCRELSQWIVLEEWAKAKRRIGVVRRADRPDLRFYALESLRFIGDLGSLEVLREARRLAARRAPPDARQTDLTQLSYDVSEDVYWRVRGGQGLERSHHAKQQ